MLVVQMILPPATPPSEPPGLAPRRSQPVMIPASPEFSAILASPIFAPDRHPAAAEELSSTAAGSLSSYAALGAISSRAVATAVIAVPGGGIKTLHRDDELEGWRMVGVDRTQVYFERNGARHALVVGAPPQTAAPLGGPQAGNP